MVIYKTNSFYWVFGLVGIQTHLRCSPVSSRDFRWRDGFGVAHRVRSHARAPLGWKVGLVRSVRVVGPLGGGFRRHLCFGEDEDCELLAGAAHQHSFCKDKVTRESFANSLVSPGVKPLGCFRIETHVLRVLACC